MHNTFLGFDHVDMRVRSLALVESFYDALMPLLGLPRKRYVLIQNGSWLDVERGAAHNAVEYMETSESGERSRFFGVIEDDRTPQTMTRVAFRRAAPAGYAAWADILTTAGARNVEMSADMSFYPAVFFEDPAGTKLEICG